MVISFSSTTLTILHVFSFSNETVLTISDLESFTRYEFVVRAIMDGVRGADSKNLIVQTTEDSKCGI